MHKNEYMPGHPIIMPSLEPNATAADSRFGADVPRYWVNNNPVITCFYNALSTVIPEGERFFIASVRAVLDDINDPVLEKQVRSFIGQESHHRVGHNALNQMIERQGYPQQASENLIKRLQQWAERFFSPRQQLAATLALEHFSALLTDQFLRQPALHQQMHGQVRDFLLQHSIEEIEHKAVAHDVYQQLYGSYPVRIWQMLLITVLFIPNVALIQCHYLWHDRQLFNLKAWCGAIRYFWLRPGWFRCIIPGWLRYFSPRFHPWQHDNRDLLQLWQDKLKQQ